MDCAHLLNAVYRSCLIFFQLHMLDNAFISLDQREEIIVRQIHALSNGVKHMLKSKSNSKCEACQH